MKRTLAILIALFLLLTSFAAVADDDENTGILGNSYDFDNISAKLVACHVEQIEGISYLYVEFEFVNNGKSATTFENNAWIYISQNEEECYIAYEDLPNINMMDSCRAGATNTYTSAYILNDLTTEAIIEIYPMSQFINPVDKIYYHVDIADLSTGISDSEVKDSNPLPENESVELNITELQHGTLLDVKINNFSKIIVIKAKIGPSYSNKATVDQNYYNIEYLVNHYDLSAFKEVQYWAVADMTDGSESKVISFTVSQDVLQKLKSSKIAANLLGNYVTDLWILPSLR